MKNYYVYYGCRGYGKAAKEVRDYIRQLEIENKNLKIALIQSGDNFHRLVRNYKQLEKDYYDLKERKIKDV